METVFGTAKKPSNTAFAQQKLRAWQPILTPLPVIVSFFVIGIVFIPIGVVLLNTSNSVKEYQSEEYEATCGSGSFRNCTLIVKGLDMAPPIYMYYKLENFYQNHRRYVKSRNDDQLRGVVIKNYGDLQDCQPFASVGDSRDVNKFYLPCGLIARSVFNDTYVLRDNSGMAVPLSKNGVAWQSDLDVKFNNPPEDTPGVRVVPDFKDPDFIVWMRTAALPTFRKLWRVINVPLKGDYSIDVQNNFPVSSFGGKKYVVLSTSSWMGGKNPFLGYAYIVVGGLCILLAIGFGIKHRISGRVPGDTSYLEWAR